MPLGNPYIEDSDVATGAGGGLLKVNLAAGAASGTILVPGMTASSVVIQAINHSDGAELTPAKFATVAGGFTYSDSLDSKNILVFWLDKRLPA